MRRQVPASLAMTIAMVFADIGLTSPAHGDVSIIAATDAALGAAPLKTHLWLVNGNAQTEDIRLRSPHVARMDATSRVFVTLKDVPDLEIQLQQVSFQVQPGQKQQVELTLRQTTPLPAGRYKLMFTAERSTTREAIAYGAMFLAVPPVIAVGQPQVVAVDDRSDRRFVTATVRFAVTTNVRGVRVAVASGPLQRSDAPADQLPLDTDSGVTLSPRGDTRPTRAQLPFASTVANGSGLQQTKWVDLAATDEAGIDTDLFVEVRWRRQAGQPIPAGQYTGQVKLLVMPQNNP